MAVNKTYIGNRFDFFCFQVLIFFSFFSSILVNTNYASVFSGIRLLVFFILFIRIYFNQRRMFKFQIFGLPFIFLFAYNLFSGIYSIDGFIKNGSEGFMYYKQFFLFSISIYMFFYFREITKLSYDKLFTYIVFMGSIFAIANILFYFYVPPFILGQTFVGRFSVGYPTVDVIPLLFSLIIAVFYPTLLVCNFIKYILIGIISIGILSQFTGSGTVLIIAVFVIYFFYLIVDQFKNKSLSKKFLFFVCLFFITAGVIYNTVRTYPKAFEVPLSVLENRINSLSGKSSRYDVDTQEMRYEQYERNKKKYIVDDADYVLGVGFGNVTLDMEKVSNSGKWIFIENQYLFNMITYGIIGSILFIFFILGEFYQIFKINLNLPVKFMLFTSVVVYSVASYNICTLNIFQVFFLFSAFLGYQNRIKYDSR